MDIQIISPVRAFAQAENDLMMRDQVRRRNAMLEAQGRRADQQMQMEQQRMEAEQARAQAAQRAVIEEQQTAWIKNAIGIARAQPQAIPALMRQAKARGLVPPEAPDTLSPQELDALAMHYGIAPAEQAPQLTTTDGPFGSRIVQQGGRFQVIERPKPQASTVAFRPLTPDEIKAAGLPQGSSAQVGPDGKINVLRVPPIAPEKKTSASAAEVAWNMYDTAKKGLLKGLEGATTGPIAGRIPAFTAAAQTAQGGVAAMAPVLKQLFRVAGEGTFTDKDQALLLDMVPTRADLPEARAAKIANIDAIVRAKLGLPPLAQNGNTGGASGGWTVEAVD